jgi:hypothetical protein
VGEIYVLCKITFFLPRRAENICQKMFFYLKESLLFISNGFKKRNLILPVDLYGRKTRSLTLRIKHQPILNNSFQTFTSFIPARQWRNDYSRFFSVVLIYHSNVILGHVIFYSVD